MMHNKKQIQHAKRIIRRLDGFRGGRGTLDDLIHAVDRLTEAVLLVGGLLDALPDGEDDNV